MITLRDIAFMIMGAIFSANVACSSRHNEEEIRNREYIPEFDSAEDFGREESGPNSSKENYFQEIYMLQSAPKQIEFGHVCENPNEWEQRYEKKDFDRNRHQGKSEGYGFGYRRGNEDHLKERYETAGSVPGQFKIKVRWADKKGGHGEHYWDYNHSGSSVTGEGFGESAPEHDWNEDRPGRQHQKRQSPPENRPPLKKAKNFLQNLHKEVMRIVDFERFNDKIFSLKKSTHFSELPKVITNFGFPFNLPKGQPKE